MHATRVVVFPIPTTDIWAIYVIPPDVDPYRIYSGCPCRDHAIEQAYRLGIPVVTYPEED